MENAPLRPLDICFLQGRLLHFSGTLRLEGLPGLFGGELNNSWKSARLGESLQDGLHFRFRLDVGKISPAVFYQLAQFVLPRGIASTDRLIENQLLVEPSKTARGFSLQQSS